MLSQNLRRDSEALPPMLLASRAILYGHPLFGGRMPHPRNLRLTVPLTERRRRPTVSPSRRRAVTRSGTGQERQRSLIRRLLREYSASDCCRRKVPLAAAIGVELRLHETARLRRVAMTTTPGRTRDEASSTADIAWRSIIVVDIVESVRLMEQGEADFIRRWRAFVNEIRSTLLAKHDARLVKSLGDGLLIECKSAPEALALALALCACSVRTTPTKRRRNDSPAHRPPCCRGRH